MRHFRQIKQWIKTFTDDTEGPSTSQSQATSTATTISQKRCTWTLRDGKILSPSAGRHPLPPPT